jgi:P-type Mg2+ transporter
VQIKPIEYYASLNESQILAELSTTLKGLTSAEIADRVRTYGRNILVEKGERNPILEFLSHFKSPLIIILLLSAIVLAFLGEKVDATIVAVMILLSVILDYFLEHNAQKAAELLKARVKAKAVVLREGVRLELTLEEIVPGDIILLSAGSLVPADARVIESKDFFVNQSALTGESFPSGKNSSMLEYKTYAITELSNIIFLGTNVISGTATAVVVRTGAETQFGMTATKLVGQGVQTEFDRGITQFGYLVTKATIFLVLFIFLINTLLKNDLLQSFMFAVAVAVGLTPELLPMVMSVTMAQGSIRMAKKGVIVKTLPSIPNFGSMDVLCTDKTGTLTEDKIALVKYIDPSGRESNLVLERAYLNSYFQTGITNPLDAAVLSYRHISIDGYAKIDEIPFDFSRKRMSVVVERKGKRMLVTKGAPEEIFRACSHFQNGSRTVPLNLKTLDRIKYHYLELSRDGYRVLAVASRETRKPSGYNKSDETNLTLMGFVAFLDPPKEDVREIITELHDIGIEVKVITGDNELVTRKICDEIGLPVKGVLLGSDVQNLQDDALRIRVERTTIFARFSPDQKDRIITALKANNHVVGYMGDGINDAPSLRTADIGISVNTAVDIAKESADIVLTQKSLHALRDGVLEGRKTFANTMKYIQMGLSSNFGNMFSVAIAVLFLPFLPMLPVQILLNNFIYDVSEITIPTDNVDKEFIRKPKRWNMGFIKRFMWTFGPISSMFDVITFILLFAVFKLDAASFQTGWFIESLATQVMVIFIIRTKQVPFFSSMASGWLIFSSFGCVALAWLLPYTPIGAFFGFVPLPGIVLITIGVLVVMYLVTVEIMKRIFYTHNEY